MGHPSALSLSHYYFPPSPPSPPSPFPTPPSGQETLARVRVIHDAMSRGSAPSGPGRNPNPADRAARTLIRQGGRYPPFGSAENRDSGTVCICAFSNWGPRGLDWVSPCPACLPCPALLGQPASQPVLLLTDNVPTARRKQQLRPNNRRWG